MEYVFTSGLSAYKLYISSCKEGDTSDSILVTKQNLRNITEEDKIVLFMAWWHKDWAKEAVLKFISSDVPYQICFCDGKVGEIQRKKFLKELGNQKDYDRFDFMDLKSDKI